MLERVKDFRYEEIKNWKPIVSLRESYRRENSLVNVSLVITCLVALLLGYGFISGWIRLTPAETADANAGGKKPAAATANRPNTLADAAADPEKTGTARPLPNAQPIGATPASNQFAQTSFALENELAPRIAVFDVQRLILSDGKQTVRDAVLAYQQQQEHTATLALQQDQTNIYQQLGSMTETETQMYKLLCDQKSELAKLRIQVECKQYLKEVHNYLQGTLDAVGSANGYDVILPADSVLAHSAAVDVTSLVQEYLDQQTIRNRNGIQANAPGFQTSFR